MVDEFGYLDVVQLLIVGGDVSPKERERKRATRMLSVTRCEEMVYLQLTSLFCLGFVQSG